MTKLPTILRFAPTIAVTDIGRSTAFYERALGMRSVFENGDPVRFRVLDRDGVELHLVLVESWRPMEENVCHLLVDDADALHRHLEDLGVVIVSGIRDADYGMRTFVFADPDGNRIDVGADLDT